MKKKMCLLLGLCMLGLSVTGCTKAVELTENEQEIIAEYAASALLKYDKGYNSKYKTDAMTKAKVEAALMEKAKEEKMTEKPEPTPTPTPQVQTTPTPQPQPTPTPVPEQTPTPEPTQTPIPTPKPTKKPNLSLEDKMPPAEIGKMFGMEGVEVNYMGFQAVDTYPVLQENQLGFMMEASQGTKLIAVKFELLNRNEEATSCNIVGQNIKFQMRFNGADYVGVQKTLLKDDFANLNCILQPNETKEVVVISQVKAGYENTIKSVDMITRIGGENTILRLQ